MPSKVKVPREPQVGDKVKIAYGDIDLTLTLIDVKEEKRGYWVHCKADDTFKGTHSFAWDFKDIIEADWL
jgi:hypothetical protein